ncbi:hypothetical protein [Peribacillus frigoritolerans]|uniref:hypothetical protein n=1 Tax=Peribacillus frigoritolerans TaxID=450367 RepID=UPI003B8D2FC9
MAVCAYCGNKGDLTKEHVIPSWLYEATKNQNLQLIQAQPKKFINNQQTKKDVCETCNNIALSKLDNYVKNLHDEYFRNIVKNNESIVFNYNFDFLARWLLKVSFNSARANKGNYHVFSNLKKYMINGTDRPSKLTIMIQLITPQVLSKRERDLIPDENLRKLGVITPNTTRISRLDAATTSVDPQKFDIARMVMVNSYQFFIFLPSDKVQSDLEWDDLLNQFGTSEITSGVQKLMTTENSIKVSASKVKLVHTMEHHIMRNLKVYSQLINDRSPKETK